MKQTNLSIFFLILALSFITLSLNAQNAKITRFEMSSYYPGTTLVNDDIVVDIGGPITGDTLFVDDSLAVASNLGEFRLDYDNPAMTAVYMKIWVEIDGMWEDVYFTNFTDNPFTSLIETLPVVMSPTRFFIAISNTPADLNANPNTIISNSNLSSIIGIISIFSEKPKLNMASKGKTIEVDGPEHFCFEDDSLIELELFVDYDQVQPLRFMLHQANQPSLDITNLLIEEVSNSVYFPTNTCLNSSNPVISATDSKTFDLYLTANGINTSPGEVLTIEVLYDECNESSFFSFSVGCVCDQPSYEIFDASFSNIFSGQSLTDNIDELGAAGLWSDLGSYYTVSQTNNDNSTRSIEFDNLQISNIQTSGQVVSSKVWNSGLTEIPTDMVEVDCNGQVHFLITGHTTIQTNSQAFITNINATNAATGANSRVFGMAGVDITKAHAVALSSSGSYFAAVGQHNDEVLVITGTPCDNLFGARVYDLGAPAIAWGVTEVLHTPDPGGDTRPHYAITGEVNGDVFLMIINKFGNIIYNEVGVYDLGGNYARGISIVETSTGSITINGLHETLNGEFQSFLLDIAPKPSINSPLNFITWLHTQDIVGGTTEFPAAMVLNDKGNYVIAGRTNNPQATFASSSVGAEQAFLMEVDSDDASINWLRFFEDNNGSAFTDVHLGPDRGYFCTGYHFVDNPSTNSINYNIYTVKTNEFGQTNECDCYVDGIANSNDIKINAGYSATNPIISNLGSSTNTFSRQDITTIEEACDLYECNDINWSAISFDVSIDYDSNNCTHGVPDVVITPNIPDDFPFDYIDYFIPAAFPFNQTDDSPVTHTFGSPGTYTILVGPSYYIYPNNCDTLFTYTIDVPDCCSCSGNTSIGTNLVTNGHFEQGNTSFYSGVSENCACVSASYCIASIAKDKCAHSSWGFIHAPSGSGNYLVMDGSNGVIWGQTGVSVTNGMTYNFAFDFYPNVSGDPSPTLALFVDNVLVANNITAPLNTWSLVCEEWTATADLTDINVEIRQMAANGFSDYGIDNICFTAQTPPLPLDILSFEASALARSILLNWDIENEVNGQEIILERSVNGRDFQAVYVTNKLGLQKYKWEDIEVKSGILYYYRLQIKDEDGRTKYSTIRSAKIQPASKVIVYPNPSHDLINIELEIQKEDDIEVKVINVQGQVCLQQQFQSNIGNNHFQVNWETLPAGIYMLQIGNQYQRVVKN